MLNKDFKYPDTVAFDFVIDGLKKRGVDLHQLVGSPMIYSTTSCPPLPRRSATKNC